jgi:Na+-transporting NADH:ubiquinone oxidoreductase subunit NqrC
MNSIIPSLIELLINLIVGILLVGIYFGYFLKPTQSDENILDDTPPKKSFKGKKLFLIVGIGMILMSIIRFFFA